MLRFVLSKLRPKAQPLDLVIIGTVGNRKQLYEGCISGGRGNAGLFARVPRYKKLTIRYYDEHGNRQERTFEGLVAHVVQHEVDHLDGILFVDRVRDTRTYMSRAEYLKHVKRKLLQKR